MSFFQADVLGGHGFKLLHLATTQCYVVVRRYMLVSQAQARYIKSGLGNTYIVTRGCGYVVK